jgi:hypothetical protein
VECSSGVEYGARETTPFVIDGTLGTAAAPYILRPEGIFQVIPLKKGWNWISLNVSNPDMSREKIFSSIMGSGNSLTVKNQTNSLTIVLSPAGVAHCGTST